MNSLLIFMLGMILGYALGIIAVLFWMGKQIKNLENK